MLTVSADSLNSVILHKTSSQAILENFDETYKDDDDDEDDADA